MNTVSCEICGSLFTRTGSYQKRTCSRSCARKLQIVTTGMGSNSQIHGYARQGKVERLHNIWRGILKRCYSKTHYSYQTYGARGIFVCDEWKDNYVAFREWFLSQGSSEGLTIDRIDNSGPYSPDNCKLSTAKDQARNRRTSRVLEYNGACKTVAEWSELLNIPAARIFARIDKLGWSVVDALEKDKNFRHIELA